MQKQYNSLIMQAKQLLYNWEAIVNVLPYLTIGDIVRSATISKQWSYHLNMYIKKALLTNSQADLHHNGLTILKMLYHREPVLIKFPQIPTSVEIGESAFMIKTVQGTKYLGWNSCICPTPYQKKDWVNGVRSLMLKTKDEVKCIHQFLYIVRDSSIVRYRPFNGQFLANEEILHFDSTIDHFKEFQSGCLVVTGQQSQNTKTFFISHKQFKPMKLDFPAEIDEIHKNLIPIYGEQALLIHKNTLYQVQLSGEIKMKEFKFFKGKQISKVLHGSKHYFAFQRKKKLYTQWNTEDIIKWAEEEKLNDYIKIFKAEKITGIKLMEADKNYLEDVLGVTSFKHQQKIKMLLQQLKQNSEDYENFNVYAWGKNERSQLLSNATQFVNNPIKVKLPENHEIFSCSGVHTFVRNTKTGEIFVNHAVKEGKFELKLANKDKIWSIASMKDFGAFIAITSCGQSRIPQAMSELPVHHKKQKLRTAKNIIDKIQWDEHLNKDDFRVGYMDKFTGILEMSFSQYLMSEIKQYHIMYFKEGDKVVWDKKARFDIL